MVNSAMDNTKLHKVLFSLVLSSSACLFLAKVQAQNIVMKSAGHTGDSHFNQDDFLKINGVVATGGEAKVRIQAGE